jgi:hypothetical protein
MKLEILSFADAGDISKERLVLKARADIDVGEYAVLRSMTGASGSKPTSGRKAAYWFPDVEVKAGDLVILYTKTGTRSTKALESGSTAYYFYWKKDGPQWGDGEYGAVLLEVADWQFKTP